jgi:hypothetical protein
MGGELKGGYSVLHTKEEGYGLGLNVSPGLRIAPIAYCEPAYLVDDVRGGNAGPGVVVLPRCQHHLVLLCSKHQVHGPLHPSTEIDPCLIIASGWGEMDSALLLPSRLEQAYFALSPKSHGSGQKKYVVVWHHNRSNFGCSKRPNTPNSAYPLDIQFFQSKI